MTGRRKRRDLCAIVLAAGALAACDEHGTATAPVAADCARGGPCDAAPNLSCEGACEVGSSRCVSARAAQACALRAGCGHWAVPSDCAGRCDAASGRCAGTSVLRDALPATCASDLDCGPDRLCLDEAGGLTWPARRCVLDCTRRDGCAANERCADVASGRSACVPACDPRRPETCGAGLVCEPDGVGGGLCLPRCTTAACARLGLACDDGTGRCEPCGRSGERCCPSAGGGPTDASCESGRCVAGTCG